MQGVVLHGLPRGTVRHLGHLRTVDHKAAVAAAPVTAAVAQVGVGRQVIPEAGQGLQVRGCSPGPTAKRGGVEHRKAGRGQLRLQIGQRGERWRRRHAAA
jgi:hypothetical protein